MAPNLPSASSPILMLASTFQPPDPATEKEQPHSGTEILSSKIPVIHTKKSQSDGAIKKLRPIYDEMRTRQRKAITNAGSMRADKFFTDAQTRLDDKRRCLAISSVMNDSVECDWSDDFFRLRERLSSGEFGSNGLLFDQNIDASVWNGDEALSWSGKKRLPCGQLHWTAMQLVGFSDFEKEVCENDVYMSEEYLDCIQDSLLVGGMNTSITITFVGVIAVSTGLLMVGIPSVDVNDARDILRNKLTERGLPLLEPFVNDIVHSTLYRVVGHHLDSKGGVIDAGDISVPPDMHLKILQLAEEYESKYLGTVTLRKFQIGPASWRMLSSELEYTPPYRKWELSDQTPMEAYVEENCNMDTVISGGTENGVSASPRTCFTVSGASGKNLAREVKSVLNRQELKILDDTDSEGTSLDSKNESSLPAKNKKCSPTYDDERRKNDVWAMVQDSKILDKFPAKLDVKGAGSNKEEYNLINSSSSNAEGMCAAFFNTPVPKLQVELSQRFDAAHATTLSGTSGSLLAHELQMKLQQERMLLESMYNTDFY